MITEAGWDSTPNSGPITWATQHAAYRRNECVLKKLKAEGLLEATACEIARRCLAMGYRELRGNGTGDLFKELAELYALLSHFGLHVFIFSRRPVMIQYLTCLVQELEPVVKPFVLGSIDPSTKTTSTEQLIAATALANGIPTLAYATATGGLAGCAEVDSHPYRQHIQVVLGYHTNMLKTKLGHELECPATAGKPIKCNQCRRCMEPLVQKAADCR
jgi:hypothetical protein